VSPAGSARAHRSRAIARASRAEARATRKPARPPGRVICVCSARRAPRPAAVVLPFQLRSLVSVAAPFPNFGREQLSAAGKRWLLPFLTEQTPATRFLAPATAAVCTNQQRGGVCDHVVVDVTLTTAREEGRRGARSQCRSVAARGCDRWRQAGRSVQRIDSRALSAARNSRPELAEASAVISRAGSAYQTRTSD
jgi:hypothetical protein